MLDNLIGNIDNLDARAAEELVNLLDQYPYCQGLQLMYTIALANLHSTRLKEQVQIAALTMPDRFKLCQMVSNGEYEWISLMNEIESKDFSQQADETSDDFLLIDRYLDNVGELPTEILPYNIEVAAPEYTLDTDDAEPDEQDVLIDNFIKAEKKGKLFVPQVQNEIEPEEEDEDSLSLKKIREKAFLSESLAKIYVKQHKYEQAIAIFSALNLKYSKKYTYFADQIRYLEMIISYQNGENPKTEN